MGDEQKYYEVEATLDNGNQIDVQLDDFNVVAYETENPNAMTLPTTLSHGASPASAHLVGVRYWRSAVVVGVAGGTMRRR